MAVETIITLSDGQTWDYPDDCSIIALTEKGEAALCEYGEPTGNADEIEKQVSLRDVLDFYNKHHNTSF